MLKQAQTAGKVVIFEDRPIELLENLYAPYPITEWVSSTEALVFGKNKSRQPYVG
jgi:hypothetical protein